MVDTSDSSSCDVLPVCHSCDPKHRKYLFVLLDNVNMGWRFDLMMCSKRFCLQITHVIFQTGVSRLKASDWMATVVCF